MLIINFLVLYKPPYKAVFIWRWLHHKFNHAICDLSLCCYKAKKKAFPFYFVEQIAEPAVRKCSSKLVFLKLRQYLQENVCVRISFLIKSRPWRPGTLLKRDSNTGALLKYCEIFKNSFFYRTPLMAASEIHMI